MKTWKEKLEQAKILWLGGSTEWRDIKVEVGQLIHQSLIERLQEEADPFCHRTRLTRRVTRKHLLREVAEFLKMQKKGAVNHLIVGGQIANLLSDNGKLGEMMYSNLFYFQSLIQRPNGTVLRYKTAKEEGRLTPSQREIWYVREPAEQHRNLFQRAVSENWNRATIRAKVPHLGKGKTLAGVCLQRAVNPERETTTEVEDIKQVIRVGTPPDVADLIFRLIQESSVPT